MAIIAVFDAALLGFTTVRISSEPFNAPLYRSWSSFWRIRHSWRRRTLGLDQIIAIGSVFDGATLGLTPPTPGIEQFWPFKYTRRPPTLGLTPPYTRPGQFLAIGSVFDGATLAVTTPPLGLTAPGPVFAYHRCV